MRHTLNLVDELPEQARDIVSMTFTRDALDKKLPCKISEETALQYNRARSYDPTIGTWISKDGKRVPANQPRT